MAVSTRTTLRTLPRTLPRPMWALVFGSFLNRFGDFVSVFLVLYLTERGYTVPQAGLAIGAYGAGSVIAAAPGGRLTDRYGRRNAIVVSTCGSAVNILALSQAQGLLIIVVLTQSSLLELCLNHESRSRWHERVYGAATPAARRRNHSPIRMTDSTAGRMDTVAGHNSKLAPILTNRP